MLSIDAESDRLIARQTMRMLRREILAMCAHEAVLYGVTASAVASHLADEQISPSMQREWGMFVRVSGLPRDRVRALTREIIEAKQDIWEFEDLRLIVEAYGRSPTELTREHVNEVLDFARRVARTMERRAKDGPKMDALVRQVLSIPEGERQ